MKRLAIIIGTALGFYLAAMAALYLAQRKVLYVPPAGYYTPAGVGLDNQYEVFDGFERHSLIGWWIEPETASAPVIIFFHGNGSAVYSGAEIYKAFQSQGYGVFAVAYPGYPGRNGKPTQESLVEAARKARVYVNAQGIPDNRIVYYGTSLGAGIASQLAAEREPGLLILEAPFYSAKNRAQNMFPMFPSGRLIKDKFRSDLALANVNAPLLWLHGTQDRVIPIAEGRALYDAYGGPKQKMVFEGGQHNDLWYRGGDAVILGALSAQFPKE